MSAGVLNELEQKMNMVALTRVASIRWPVVISYDNAFHALSNNSIKIFFIVAATRMLLTN